MSETCSVNIINKAGRSIDKIAIWHTSGEPEPSDLTPSNTVIEAENVPNGKTLSGTAQLTRFSPTDNWTMGVLFEGDGTLYLMCGYTVNAWKEYEVSDDSTIGFTIPKYTTDTTNQSDVSIAYSGDDGGEAFLLNEEIVEVVSIVKAVGEALSELVE